MPCNSSSLTKEDGGRKPPPAAPTYDSTPEGPALIVSNSPERITTTYGTAKVLYRGYGSDEVDSFRLFFWHLVNRQFIGFPSGVPEDMPEIEFGLMFKTSVTGTVSNRKQILKVEGWNDPSIPGSCLANAQLMGTLDSESGSFSVGGSGPWCGRRHRFRRARRTASSQPSWSSTSRPVGPAPTPSKCTCEGLVKHFLLGMPT